MLFKISPSEILSKAVAKYAKVRNQFKLYLRHNLLSTKPFHV